MAFAETARLIAELSLDASKFNRGVGSALGSVGKLDRGLGRAGKGAGQLATGLGRAGLVIGGAVVAGLGAAAKTGADFEAQLNVINTIAHATPEALDGIGDGIRQLAREGRGDLADLSAGFYDVLSAGITNAADAQKVLTSATTLAIGGLATNAQAVDLLTTAINAYRQNASDAQKDADLFAKAIEIGKVTADEIASSFANVAPIAAQVGINIEEVAAAYGALTAQGTPAEEVATQMQRAILELLKPSKDLRVLQDELGVSFLKIAQDKGLVVALQQMRDAVGDDDAAFKNLFGRVEGYKFALQTTGPQNKIYNDALKDMANSAGTASEQMGERTRGLAFQLSRVKANLKDAAIELASGFLPALTRSADKLSTFLNTDANRVKLRAIGEDIGKAIDGIEWDKVLDGAKTFYDVMKGAASVALDILKTLNALPTEVKAAGLGLLGLNKLSGGLIGAGVGNLVGGIAQGLGGALVRAGIGKAFVQPVFVVNMGAGMGGGATGGGSSVLGAAGVATAAVAGGISVAQIAQGVAAGYNASQKEDVQGVINAQKNIFDATLLIPPGLRELGQWVTGEQQKIVDQQRAAAERITTRVENMKGAMVQSTARAADRSTNAAERTRSSIVAAIRGIQRPIVSVSVVGNTVRTVYRTGGTVTRNVSKGSMDAGLQA